MRIGHVLGAVGALLAAQVALSPAALAGGRACGNRTVIIQRLAEKYGETRQSMGLQRDQGVIEIFASQESGTWTILMTMPNGMACLVAAGEAWDGQAELAVNTGKPT
ncbi:hypothetical protein FDP22_03635 [Paroceanicella profunda]|uniref:Uncharacterized protein n=1 Tax=Paroceanicella profunda TaxID=2579971 RepID=A0A5B8FWT1_9RHOB|nr:hypothetical protein [Paroceanicella profunda]QDL90959.1 hypothetical protein FDP22_03635 [Paroceanicella profunda]